MSEPEFEFVAVVIAETEKAWKVRFLDADAIEDDDGGVWLPKSQAEIDGTGKVDGDGNEIHSVIIPAWLAAAKGID